MQNRMFLTTRTLPLLLSYVSQRRKPQTPSPHPPPKAAREPPLWTVPGDLTSFPPCFFLLLVFVFSFYQSDPLISASRATPEPPAGPREYLLDPPGIAYGADENRAESDLREEENEVQDNIEEERSFLQEVLSSLKTPLDSCSLGMETEGVVQEIEEEVKENESEDVEVDEAVEVKEEEEKVDEPVRYQAAPAGFLLSDQTTEEEEEVDALSMSTPSWLDVEEEDKDEDKEEETAEEEDEEELVVEQFSQHDVCI